MQLKRIIKYNVSDFEKCFEIYKTSFPIFEQRVLVDQINALINKDYHYEAILDETSEVLGLLLTWHTEDFIYIEHFAILESARGKNIGTKVLNHLEEQSNKPIILEIDPPTDDISIRRQGFYERLGFELSHYDHFHPAYRKDRNPHQLKIMSIPKISDDVYEKFDSYLNKTIMVYSQSH